MRLGDILVARGMVSIDDIGQAVARQQTEGGRLGDNLIALGLLTQEQFEEVIHDTPQSPKTMIGTGIPMANLMTLLMRTFYVEQLKTTAQFVEALKLPQNIVSALLKDAEDKKYVEAAGSGGMGIGAELSYSLTASGRIVGAEALERSHYIGPAPVSLSSYQEQILKQRITNEHLSAADIDRVFEDLIIPEHFARKVGPAINSGNTILLYGPPGNGKTSIATQIAKIFKHIIYVPYAVEIEGQIMKVFDGGVHIPAIDDQSAEQLARQNKGLRKEDFDHRWVACRRPTVIVGGELTLDMLDLRYNTETKFYEAPMHVKALGGTFIVDDFGRQIVSPEALLNRWIVPMESRVDFFKLNSGKSFMIPFDELLIFSTNMAPHNLMDAAFLRRIPYKIELFAPTLEDFKSIFTAIAAHSGLDLPDDVFDFAVAQLKKGDHELAYYQPKFICDQVLSICKYDGAKPIMTEDLVRESLKNLYVKPMSDEQEKNLAAR